MRSWKAGIKASVSPSPLHNIVKPFVSQTNVIVPCSFVQVVEFVKKNVGTYTPLLAGNSVYMDFLFLKVWQSIFMCLYLSLNEITHGYVMDMAQLHYSGASIIHSPIGLAFILSNTSILLDNVQYSYQTPFIFMHTDVHIHTHTHQCLGLQCLWWEC